MFTGVQDEALVERRPGVTERRAPLEHDVIDLAPVAVVGRGEPCRPCADDDNGAFLDWHSRLPCRPNTATKARNNGRFDWCFSCFRVFVADRVRYNGFRYSMTARL